MKRFVHICEEFEYMWIGKDNGLLPIYMHEVNGYVGEIWSNNLKKDLPEEVRGVKFIEVKQLIPGLRNFASWTKFVKRIPLYLKLIKEGRDIDILMLFHMTKSSYWNAYFYKKINPKGKVYVKADFNLEIYKKEMSIIDSKAKNMREFFKKTRYTSEYRKRRKLASLADHISYETKEAYEYMKDSYAGVCTKGKTFYLPNGFDNNLLKEFNIEIKAFEEKENIMMTVGRLGTKEKNTEMILKALETLELKDWKFYFIGPIEESFQIKIKEFYKENPDKKESVIFTGAIYDRLKLYDYYNRSKVFVLSSRWESSAIVLIEAAVFRNFTISTDVGAVKDITNDFRYGEEINQENSDQLREKIKRIIAKEVQISKRSTLTNELVKDNFFMEKLIEKLKHF